MAGGKSYKDIKITDSNGNVIDPATESTISSIDSKIVKVDTDNVVAKITDSNGTVINPATEETANDMVSFLDSIDSNTNQLNNIMINYGSWVTQVRRRQINDDFRVIQGFINMQVTAGGEIDVFYVKPYGPRTLTLYNTDVNDLIFDITTSTIAYKYVGTAYKGDNWIPVTDASVFSPGMRVAVFENNDLTVPISESYVVYVDTINNEIALSSPLVANYTNGYVCESFLGNIIPSIANPDLKYHVINMRFVSWTTTSGTSYYIHLYTYEDIDPNEQIGSDYTVYGERVTVTKVDMSTYAVGVNNPQALYEIFIKDISYIGGETLRYKKVSESIAEACPSWVVLDSRYDSYMRVYYTDVNSYGPEVTGCVDMIQEAIQ